MYFKKIILGLSITCLSINAATGVLDSPYLQFPSELVPAAYKDNPSEYAKIMVYLGKATYRRIVLKRIDLNELKKNPDKYVRLIASLMFYFFSKAVKKNQGFSSGSIVLKDPGFKIYNFLYTYVAAKWKPRDMGKEALVDVLGRGAYPRKSTHFNAFYIYTGKAKKGVLGQIKKTRKYIHYGIDMPKGLILPSKRKHVLFGKIESDPSLIFVKFEFHGLGKKDVVSHTGGLIKAQVRKFAGKNAKMKKLLEHFVTVASDDSDDARRERIPLEILAEFLELMLAAEGSPIKKEDLDLQGIKGLGIRKILSMTDSHGKGYQGTNKWRMRLTEFSKKIRHEYDHSGLRTGREVILVPGYEL